MTGSPNAAFVTTHWSAVLNARDGETPEARAALEWLCTAYWYPLYAHVRRRGHGPDDAADFTQEFFRGLLRRNSLARVGPERGRFRTFLLTALDYSLRDQFDRESAAKRGGGVPTIPLDTEDAEKRFAIEPATDETPDRAFDRRWATALLERAMDRLRVEQIAAGKADLFERLRPMLGREVEAGEYDQLARDLSMPPNTVAKTVQRLRRRARELLIDEAAHTVAAAGDAEQELRELFG